MRQCIDCGRKGLFLKVNARGQCKACEEKQAKAREEAWRRHRQEQKDAANKYIEEMGAKMQIALRDRTILPHFGYERIKEQEQAARYVKEHIDEWERYYDFPRLFLARCKGNSALLEMPLWKCTLFSADDAGIRKAIDRIKKDIDQVCTDCMIQAWKAYDYSELVIVAGVTFSNGDRQRQTILRQLKSRRGEVDFSIERETFEGEPAFAVYADGEKVGYVPRTQVPWFVEHWDEYSGVVEYDITGGRGGNYYGLGIRVAFRRKREETAR